MVFQYSFLIEMVCFEKYFITLDFLQAFLPSDMLKYPLLYGFART